MEGITLFDQIDDLDNESKYLVHKAKDATRHAYAPYSKFLVGAAILFEDETFTTGSNQENAAYSLCMCAERVALYNAAVQQPDKIIKRLAVVAHKKNHKDLAEATPCGACRQVLMEFEERQKSHIVCIFLGPKSKWFTCQSIAYLLPLSFGSLHNPQP